MGAAASVDKYAKVESPKKEDSSTPKRKSSNASLPSLPSAEAAAAEKDTSQPAAPDSGPGGSDDAQLLRHGSLVQHKEGEIADHFDLRGEIMPGYTLAVNKKSSEHQAVRCIPKKERTITSIEAEVEILQKIDHPNVATLFEVFEDENHVYLVTELCPDGTLAALVEQEGNIEERGAANIMKQVMRGVMYMHDQHYCHRDLHPAGIMFQSCELGLKSCKARLMDLQSASPADKSKKMKGVVGEVEFASPQMLLKEQYTNYCDVWSCGVLLFFMVMGVVPFPKGVVACFKSQEEDVSKWDKVCTQKLTEHKMGKMSSSLSKMLKKMIIFQEKGRWSLEGCIRWTWFDECGFGAPKLALTVSEVESMNNFAGMNKLQKMAVTIIARRLPDETTDKLREVFDSIDLDCNGVVTYNELHNALKKFKGVTEETSFRSRKACAVFMDTRQLMNALDTNGNNGLDFSEFIAAALPRKYYTGEGMLKAAFNALDADGSGEISLEELEAILLADRQVASEEEKESIREVLKAADLNGDGEISFDEFVEMMKDTSAATAPEPEPEEDAVTPTRRSSLASLADMAQLPSRKSSLASLPGLNFSNADKKPVSRSSSRNSSKQSTAPSARRSVTGQSSSSLTSGTSSVVSRKMSSDRKPERRPSLNSLGSFLA